MCIVVQLFSVYYAQGNTNNYKMHISKMTRNLAIDNRPCTSCAHKVTVSRSPTVFENTYFTFFQNSKFKKRVFTFFKNDMSKKRRKRYQRFRMITTLAYIENQVRGRSRSLKMVPFDRPYATLYWSFVVNISVSCTIFKHLHKIPTGSPPGRR